MMMNLGRVYQCKLCRRIFSSGPMLGGHMRCHLPYSLPERVPPLVIGNSSKEERRVGYSLRENPKKSWKLSELQESATENPCPVCDRRFRSMRALFCHLKIHWRKHDESGDRCKDRGKGSRSTKSCRDRTRPIHHGESLLKEDRFEGSSKTKSDLLLLVLADDEAMHVTRRKRTPRIAYDVNERTEGVLLSAPDGSSSSSVAEQDPGTVAAGSLIMISRCETGFNSSGLGVQPFTNSSAPDFFDVGKGRVTEASECNESHPRGYSRMERKGVELEVAARMHKKPKAARSGKEPMYEAAMMDREAMGTAGSDSRERAELWLEQGLDSFRDKVCAEESQVFEYKSKDAESYKQEVRVDASHEIEGIRGCTGLESIEDDSEKANRQVCSISRAISEKGDAPDIGV
ncbi:uncharacterized protein LOC115673976 [Syzygium oleosum]|uniref:uncharacterized protein LOC115673976 n=1 Tax=Syzygium oleosum TaxID=219896 RepID=UPI0011D1BACE|nr:uncharacterized protein LOC115673976 [Syzygium oleosum]